jgi:hypothetical protein
MAIARTHALAGAAAADSEHPARLPSAVLQEAGVFWFL